MNKGLRKAVIFALSAGLVLTSLAGCSKKETFDTEATALTVNDETLSVGVVNFAVRYSQSYYEDMYASFGVTDPFNQDLFGTGSTMGESTKSSVVSGLTHTLLAEQKMEEYGVSITDEDKTKITEAATAFMEANDEEVLEALGATQEIVERYLELSMIQSKMETAMSADVDTEVSDEEAAQRKIEYVFFAPVTEEETEAVEAETDGETEAADAEAETVAEDESEAPEATETEGATLTEEETARTQAAAETEAETEEGSEAEEAAGTEAQTAAEEETEAVTEAGSEEETEAETEDPETAAAKARAYDQAAALIEKLKAGEDIDTAAEEMGKTASSMTFGADYATTELVEATDGLDDDTLVEEPVETSTGYYVVKLVTQLDREATDEKKESIVEERKDERIDELYEEWEADSEVAQDAEVLATIVFDYSLTQYVEPETEAAEGSEEAAEEESAAEAAETEEVTEAAGTEAAVTEAGTEASEAETEAVETESETEEAVTEAETK